MANCNRVLRCATVATILKASLVLAAPVPPERPRDSLPAPAPSERPETPPDQLKLERLAQLLGTLAFLRDLCPPRDGDVWRGKMEDLLEAEGATPSRRERLAGAYNRGFGSYRVAYRQCTPAAGLIIERALGEGSELAHDLSARFGG